MWRRMPQLCMVILEAGDENRGKSLFPGRFALVGHNKNPQPCLAVKIAVFTLGALIESNHCEVFSKVGRKVFGSDVGPVAYGALSF